MDHVLDAVVRFLHILAGIVWIGHLYFFNLTNLPVFNFNISNGDPAQKAGPNLMHRALFWFRWGAMATLVFGLWLYMIRADAYGSHADYFADPAGRTIALGMLLGIIMWFNVWFIIWPNQKVVLGNNIRIAKGLADEEKKKLEAENAPRVSRAKLASRINFWLSIPMLLFMVFAAHAPDIFG
ncbi:MAG TPA: hypothetical protein VFH47_08375 [Candidatus Thermoplasmatota archaeon]|nr:hypothetical protein [Candidatus Thermoplasmatota archaeon]